MRRKTIFLKKNGANLLAFKYFFANLFLILFLIFSIAYGGTAKVCWVHHGNQHIGDHSDYIGYHNSRPGYWATIDTHVYNNMPVDIHISGPLLQSFKWLENDRGLLNALKTNTQIELLGSAYSQHILPYADEDINIFALNYYKDLLSKSLNPVGTCGGFTTFRPIVVWIPERVWKDFLLNDVSQTYWRDNPGRSPLILLDDNVAQWYGLNSHKIYKIESGLDRVYVGFICSIAREHWLDADFPTNPNNPLRIHLAELANAADQEQVCIYADDWEKAAGVAGWWDNTALYDANIYYAKTQSSWIQPVHLSEVVEWWRDSAPSINIPYAAYELLQSWTGGNYDYWFDDYLTVVDGRPYSPWGKECIFGRFTTVGNKTSGRWIPYGLNTARIPDVNNNGLHGDCMDLWRLAVDKLRENCAYPSYSRTTDSRTGIVSDWNPKIYFGYPTVFGNSINQVGWITLVSQYFETAWHNGTQNHIEGWAKNLHNHIRHAGAFAFGAYWLNNLPAPTVAKVTVADFDFDGYDEYAIYNSELCAIFDAIGGRALWVFTKDSTVIVGNSMSNWGGEGDWDDGGHPGLFKDYVAGYTNGNTYYNVTVLNFTGATVSIKFDTWGISNKTISLSTGKKYLKIEYTTSGESWISAGISPDIKQLLDYGYSLEPIIGLSPNGWMFAGYKNTSTDAKGCFLWASGAGFKYNDFGRMYSLANKIELGGKSGNFTFYFFAGKGTPDLDIPGPGDQEGPIISEVKQNPRINILEYSSVTVTAKVYDISSVASVWLRYGINSSWTYPDIPMYEDNGTTYDWDNDSQADLGLYGCIIPGQPKGTLVEYTIRAIDGAGKESWATIYGQNFWYKVGLITFIMDGKLDSVAQLLATNGGMHLWGYYYADSCLLYIATEAAGNQVGRGYDNDHFIFISRNPSSSQTTAPWAKAGLVAKWDCYLADENDNEYFSWFDVNTSNVYAVATSGSDGEILEGVINLHQLYSGSIPSVIYIAVGSYSTADGGTLQWQVPIWTGTKDANIDAGEYYPFTLYTGIEEKAWYLY